MTIATARRAKLRKAPAPRVDLAARAKSARPPTDERGSAGTVGWGGVMSSLAADYAPAWQLPRRWTTMENMRADPAVTAALAALVYPLLGASFVVEAASDDAEDARLAEFIDAGLTNMTTDLMTHRMEALDSVGDGVSVFYTRYEAREDGLYHLRKLKLLPNKAIQQWHVEEEHGGPDGVSQVLPTGREERFYMDDLLVFTHMRRGDSLLGRPALRAMYRPWFLIDKLSRIGAIAVERGASGTPWARYTGGSDTEAAKLDRALQGLHANERAFFRVDEDVPDWGIKGIEGATVDPVPLMEFQRRDLFLAPLAQFLALGTDGIGSMALSGDHSSFFLQALEFIARELEDTYNRYLIPRWIGYNWTVPADRLPRVKIGALDRRDVGAWTQSVAAMVAAGVPLPMEALAEEATRMLGITVPEKEEAPEAAAGNGDDVADVNDPNAEEADDGAPVNQRAAGVWPGVTLAAKAKGKGKKCGNSYVSASYTCRDDNPRSFAPDERDTNNKDLFYDFADTVAHPDLSQGEGAALDAYTEFGYRDVNASLRGRPTRENTVPVIGADGKEVEAPIGDVVASMDSVFAKAPTLSEPVVTYRGGRVPANAKPGDEFTDAGFVSTGGAPFTAVYSFWSNKRNDPSYAVMEIVSPKGTKAIIPDVALKRAKGDRVEGELILNRGTRFRVKERRRDPYPFGDSTVEVPVLVVEVIP